MSDVNDMTPQQAADDIVGVKWLDMHEHADALRVLIAHARAAAPGMAAEALPPEFLIEDDAGNLHAPPPPDDYIQPPS